MIFYFTGTGNSLYVAKKIGGNLIPLRRRSGKKDSFIRMM